MELGETLLVSAAAIGASWLRMGIALTISIIFSLAVGILAGTNKRAERLIIPLLDILQSIPILGFFPLALYGFYSLIPFLGAELASIFLIFTSQVWNMTFAVYESTRVIGSELLESARSMRLTVLDRMRYIYVPASMPRLLQNLQPSWSNGIFFLVGSEILTFGRADITLFGLGSLISDFVEAGDTRAVLTLLTLLVVAAVLTNLLVFNPLTGLTERRRSKGRGQVGSHPSPPARGIVGWISLRSGVQVMSKIPHPNIELHKAIAGITRRVSTHWSLLRGLVFFALTALVSVAAISRTADLGQVLNDLAVALLEIGPLNLLMATLYSLLRVTAGVLASIAWSLPVALLIFRSRRGSAAVTTAFQIAASIPVTILYPVISSVLPSADELRALVLVLMATQWYVFFQVLGGLRNIPPEELEIAEMYRLSYLDRLRYLYLWRAMPALVTGCVVAAGGAWNALVIAERIVLGNIREEVSAPGLGKLLSIMVEKGDLYSIIIIVLVMAAVIVGLNRGLWKRLYDLVVSRLRTEDVKEHGYA